MSQSTYTVSGMTCGHCADAVRRSVGGLAGVRRVEVDLASGHVTVTSDDGLQAEDVREAVAEAGYELTATNE